MERVTDEELAQISERVEKATEGPWRIRDARDGSFKVYAYSPIAGDAFDYLDKREDATFIAHAREDIPKLLAEVDRLKSELNGDGVLTLTERVAFDFEEIRRQDELIGELYSIALWITRRMPSEYYKNYAYDMIDKATGTESERV